MQAEEIASVYYGGTTILVYQLWYHTIQYVESMVLWSKRLQVHASPTPTVHRWYVGCAIPYIAHDGTIPYRSY